MADTINPATPVPAAPSSDLKPSSAAETAPANPQNEMFARKERQIRKMQQELARERQTLEAKQKSYDTDYVPKSRLKEDPWSVLQEAGLDYDQLTQQMLTRPNDPLTKSMYDKIRAMEQKLVDSETKAQQDTQAQYTQALKQISTEVKMLVDENPEYESIKAAGMHEAVTELIRETFDTDGYLMDIAEAAKEVENHLLDEAVKLSKLPKVQQRLQPKPEETAAVVNAQAAPKWKPTATAPLTITNRMQAPASTGNSERDRRARAIAAFNAKKTNLG